MSAVRWVSLSLLFLIVVRVSAQVMSPSGMIGDRPSAERLPLPDYAPIERPPGFTLPPARAIRPKAAAEGEPTLIVRDFRFIGNTVFTDQELQVIAAPFLGRAIGATDLEQLRYHLTKHYIGHGYINSGAILPRQVFKDGIIRFQIIEGELSEIRITGTGGLRPAYVRDRLELGAGPPLNDQVLQDRFQLLLTDPLIERMDGRLMPGLAPGQSILDVNVTRTKPYTLSFSVDNYRPPSTGAKQVRMDGQVRNMTGFGDLLSFYLGYGEERLDIDTGITLPITRYDTLLGFQYANRRSSILEEPLDDLDIDSRFRSFDITLYHPVYHKLEQQFILGARLALRKNTTTLLNRRFSFSSGEENGQSKVTALRLSQEFLDSRVNQVFSFRSTFSVGLNLFDATWHSDDRPDGDFLAWLGQLQYARQVMDNRAQIRFRGDVQVANDQLLPLEQYAIGGVYSVRGYRENELVRDQGYSLSVELHYPLFSSGIADTIPGVLVAIPFMDYGAAWDKGSGDNTQYLHGVGIGLAWNHPRFSAELFYAKNLNNTYDKREHDLQDVSIYFRVTTFMF